MKWSDLINDDVDETGDVEATTTIGAVRLIPLFYKGARALGIEHTPSPATFAFRTFTGYRDPDGLLKNKPGGGPLRVWANDPVFGLEKLPYRFEADLTDQLGNPVPFESFIFEAPATDTELDLTTVARVPIAMGSGLTRGVRGDTVTWEVYDEGPPRLWRQQNTRTGEWIGEPTEELPSTALPGAVAAELSDQTPPAVAAELGTQTPGAVSAELAAQTPSAVTDELAIQVPAAVSNELTVQTPSAVAVELTTQVPPAVDADISGRAVTIVDTGSGEWQIQIGGVAAGSPFTLPPTTLSGINAASLCARMTVQPTWARRSLIETCIKTLIDGGVWEKLDGLYVFAAHDEQAAKLNWIGAGAQDITAVNAPVFEIDRGFTGDGATNYLDTNTPANTLEKYSANDASMGVYVRTSMSAINQVDVSAGTSAYLNTHQSGNIIIRANSSAGGAISIPNGGNGAGLTAWSRDASNVTAYKFGASVGSAAVGAGSLASMTVRFLVLSTINYSPRQLQFGFIGGGLSASEHNTINSAIVNYLTAIGAN